ALVEEECIALSASGSTLIMIMLASLVLVILLGSSSASGASVGTRYAVRPLFDYSAPHSLLRKCGSTPSGAQVLAAEAHFREHKISDYNDTPATMPAEIPVHFHVVTKEPADGSSEGDIPQAMIEEQIDVLDKAYGSSYLRFSLANTTRTVNTTWFNSAGPGSSDQTAMKKALRQGGVADLNVYTVG
ncbi:hypothetical protein DXG01_001210, partial [Tephrocybe rancida]